ncbi:ENV1 protein, partial [Grantiella picta]|nr:ENV1 protein [Grantiella picta]
TSESVDSLWKMVQASYRALNETNPNMTEACWLCYNIRPPYYEAIAVNQPYKYSNAVTSPACRWAGKKRENGMTLQHVRGKGSCIG